MDGDDRSCLPVPYHRIDNRIHIAAELPALAKRQIVGGVGGKQLMSVEIAACVVSLGVIQVLVIRTGGRCRCLRPDTVVTAVVGNAVRPGIGNLTCQPIAVPLLQDSDPFAGGELPGLGTHSITCHGPAMEPYSAG